jgi:hypothetical protein
VTMASDDEAGIFGGKRKGLSGDLPTTTAKKSKNDHYVSPGNALSRQMLEPYGENELDAISLAHLWKKASAGHEHCPRFTEYAISNDLNYQGLALAKSMKNLAVAIKYSIAPDMKELWDPAVYESFKEEAIELLPHLIVLSGGQMRKDDKKLNAYRVAAIDRGDAEKSAKAVFVWLSKPKSHLRAILKMLARGGAFYTAFANEKLTRAYIAGENVDEKRWVALCVHRLCPPEMSTSDDGDVDWTAIKAKR